MWRGVLCACCTAPLVGAHFYNQGYRVSWLVCPLRHWTGIPCPTCGMTRSFMAIASGDWFHAFAEHAFGPALFGLGLLAASHLFLEVLTGQQIQAFYLGLLRNRRLQLLSVVMLLSYHALRLYRLSQSGELATAVVHSPVGQLLFLQPSL